MWSHGNRQELILSKIQGKKLIKGQNRSVPNQAAPRPPDNTSVPQKQEEGRRKKGWVYSIHVAIKMSSPLTLCWFIWKVRHDGTGAVRRLKRRAEAVHGTKMHVE